MHVMHDLLGLDSVNRGETSPWCAGLLLIPDALVNLNDGTNNFHQALVIQILNLPNKIN